MSKKQEALDNTHTVLTFILNSFDSLDATSEDYRDFKEKYGVSYYELQDTQETIYAMLRLEE